MKQKNAEKRKPTQEKDVTRGKKENGRNCVWLPTFHPPTHAGNRIPASRSRFGCSPGYKWAKTASRGLHWAQATKRTLYVPHGRDAASSISSQYIQNYSYSLQTSS